jgi:hypothetical protein
MTLAKDNKLGEELNYRKLIVRRILNSTPKCGDLATNYIQHSRTNLKYNVLR